MFYLVREMAPVSLSAISSSSFADHYFLLLLIDIDASQLFSLPVAALAAAAFFSISINSVRYLSDDFFASFTKPIICAN